MDIDALAALPAALGSADLTATLIAAVAPTRLATRVTPVEALAAD